MIIEALLDIFFNLILLPFQLIRLPDVPQVVWDSIETLHAYLSTGYGLCQYFFYEDIWTLGVPVLIALMLAQPTIKLFMWIYNKIRGC